jgi:hypothetical protein
MHTRTRTRTHAYAHERAHAHVHARTHAHAQDRRTHLQERADWYGMAPAPAAAKKEDQVRSPWCTAVLAHVAAIGCTSTNITGVMCTLCLLDVVCWMLSAGCCLQMTFESSLVATVLWVDESAPEHALASKLSAIVASGWRVLFYPNAYETLRHCDQWAQIGEPLVHMRCLLVATPQLCDHDHVLTTAPHTHRLLCRAHSPPHSAPTRAASPSKIGPVRDVSGGVKLGPPGQACQPVQ